MLVRLSEAIAHCVEHARTCGEKARAAPGSSATRADFLDLEARWLALAESYEFSESLASRINEAHKRHVKLILGRAGADRRDTDALGCMTLAYIETMKAVGIAGTERQSLDSMTTARLVVELAKQGERDPDRLCISVLKLLNAKDQTQPQSF
jgi:hypothetical protein